ncbi:tetratricopeptide repeat protein [Phototrophicus methaneseepsis]|uniref:Tetratricopeptide repeat protein n=1 Tax=Phototrophicus methaneseepsis TaxID=2710758 RepID=A0A7S8E814_9CHLR|nr:tetratricopeptide repeat protein [Phototrophicus methaneseepsis]QPC82098.1 tetratricopeptide repeat protein [Phototrophicus methaneseepsis]
MPDTKKVRVFISYARKDDYLTEVKPGEEHTYHLDVTRSFTRQLYNALKIAGFDVWWDRENMPNRGLTFLDEIKAAVTDCDFLVYVAGPHALKSDYVRAEWQYAKSICKPVIPILRAGEYEDMIPPEMAMDNGPDMRDMAFFYDKVSELVRLLSDEPKVATLYSVPNLPDWYIERGTDVSALQASLRADALNPVVVTSKQQTVTLQGMGGLGKTTMATAVCRLCDVRYSFPDGVFWIEMGKEPAIPTRQGDIGATFGDDRGEYPDAQRGKSRLSYILQNKAALIVLDDVWDYRHVDAFRVNAPRSRLLVTTRNGRIATQLGVEEHLIDTLTEEEGVALIGKRLGRSPDADNPYLEDEKAIVQLLGGHTLAISIAAARISEEGADYTPRFRQRLETRRASGGSPLGDLNMQNDDKNYNLELSLSESYEELNAQQQAQFRALGVFAAEGTFDAAAAQAVWMLDDAYQTEDTLRFFVKLSLLDQPETGRYQQHGLLRDYAHGLSSEEELAANQKRHFEHYFNEHGDYDRNQAYQDDGSMLRHNVLSKDWEQVNIAITWGFTHEPKPAIDWVVALQAFMLMRRTLSEQFALLRSGLQVSQRIDYVQGQADMLQALGNVEMRRNAYGEAEARYREALPLYEAIGSRLGQAHTLKAMGDVAYMRNEYGEAEARYGEALPLYEAIGSRLGQANTLKALGDVAYMRNEYGEAEARFREALPLYEAIGDRLGQANTLKALGDVYRMRNEYGEAEARYGEALPLYEAIGSRVGQANTLQAMGDVAYMQDEYGEAEARYGEALPLYEAIGSRVGQANTLKALGDVEMRRNEYGEAEARYGEALPLYEAIGSRVGQANTLKALGDVAYMQDEYGEAEARYREALPLYEAIGSRVGQANTLKALGDVEMSRNEYGEAEARYREALPLYEAIGSRVGQANTLKALGDVAYMQDEYGEAEARYREALRLYEAIGDRLGQTNTLKALGDVAYMKDEYGEAEARYQEALSLYEAIGARLGQANTLKALGDVAYMQDEYGEAEARFREALILGESIGDFTVQLNSLKGLASTYYALDRTEEACAYAQRFLTLADSHPFFREHAVVQSWRKIFVTWGCDVE